MSDTPRHSVSVAGIVINEAGQVLVIRRRDNGAWEPPGGVLELDETFDDGVRREVVEETGVVVTVGPLTGIYKNMNRGIVALVFRCFPFTGQPQPTLESAKVAWLDVAEVIKRMDPAYAVRVTDAFTPDTSVRAHDGTNLISVADHQHMPRGR